MIIAMTTHGHDLDARVIGSLSRCPNIVFYDTNSEEIIDVIDNPIREMLGEDGGKEAAQLILEQDSVGKHGFHFFGVPWL